MAISSFEYRVAYGKTPKAKEVDFVARTREGKTLYIQACADLSTEQVRRREFEPLNEIIATNAKATCLLLAMTTTDVAMAQADAPSGVAVKPAWEWLLEGAKQ